ncbi:MAG: adenosylcobalamin-dependent ribonucleoside-diphosphate reductase [Candidatus Aenigmatarchaeota archaeon]|nr:adenosylcobalamin-dependent ribonucleoside-diphosphate reductase [Candidatus Aenigmarchaeota archaeon]
MKLTDNALTLLNLRYLRRNEYGEVIETPEQLFRRVAHAIAIVERKYGKSDEEIKKIEEEFYELMTSLRFLPNSPTLMNAGTNSGQLSACNVLPLEDSMESIFETIKNAAIVQKFGGGTGFSFSKLRPKGDKVGSTGGIAAGPVFFLNAFDSALKGIRQAHRRFATNMGILRVDHPDIFEFIDAKKQEGVITTFNISVGITDKFMQAVKNNQMFDLVNPRNGKTVMRLPATEIFDKIAKNAWSNGEPGLVFIDRMNNTASNPVPHLGPIEATNPCGEQPLYPYDSCNLGSIDVSKMIKDKEIDWVLLEKTVKLSVRFLDNVIDSSLFALKEIEERTKSIRRIGLGVMGFADMLIKLDIAYNSDQALELAEKLMKFITEKGREMSVELGEERGSFPEFEKSIWNGKYKALRNSTITTIAPTSNLSIIAGCSHSIEPIFSITYIRNVKDSLGTNLVETNPLFEEIAKKRGFYSEKLMKQVLAKGKLNGIDQIPDDVKRVFVVSHDISPEWHVKMQATFQKYTDNAVSKTVNLPNNATVDDVKKIYMLAYDLGCKGITVYRDGSREKQIINIPKEQDDAEKIIENSGGCVTCHL